MYKISLYVLIEAFEMARVYFFLHQTSQRKLTPLPKKSPVLFLESGSKVFPITCAGVLPAAMVTDSK